MIDKGKRIYIKQDINVDGVEIGTKATVMDVFPGELYPVQLQLDVPDADGHSIYRVQYGDIGEIPDGSEQQQRVFVVEPTEELPI